MLCWAEKLAIDGTLHRQGNFATTFPVYFGEVLWLVTAGHVLHRLRNSSNHNLKLGNARILDFSDQPCIPYELNTHNEVWIYDKKNEYDFAALPMDHLTSEGLLKAGVIPLNDNSIENPDWNLDEDAPTEYLLCGWPEEHQTITVDDTELLLKNSSTEFHVTEVKPLKQKDEFFRGRVLGPHSRIKSIKGMSGGPIIEVRKTDKSHLEYRGIAVQGKWDRIKKVITATPLKVFMELASKELDRAFKCNSC